MATEKKPVRPASMRQPLAREIEAHGEKVSVLEFREPTTSDILEIGNPVVFDPISDPPKITHDDVRMAQMIARLAGIPPSSVRDLAPRDYVACAWLISPFFVPKPGTI